MLNCLLQNHNTNHNYNKSHKNNYNNNNNNNNNKVYITLCKMNLIAYIKNFKKYFYKNWKKKSNYYIAINVMRSEIFLIKILKEVLKNLAFLLQIIKENNYHIKMNLNLKEI